MKKIILSVAVATMALSTAAAALEDIKVNGQAKLWYEATDLIGGSSLFNQEGALGSVVFKLGMTGKQGNVGFGATVYQVSTMGLENVLVGQVVTTNGQVNGGMYTGEAYVTFPAGADTVLKIGKQELDTPLVFTERWSPTPNTFNAAVAINNSIDNVTLVAAFVGQDNTATTNPANVPATTGVFFASPHSFAVQGEVGRQISRNGAYTVGALYKNDGLAVNVWGYDVGSMARAIWADAAVKVGPANVKAYAAIMMPKSDLAALEDTTALALSAGMKVGSVNLFAAVSDVSDDAGLGNALPVANVSTGFKKTKLPTMAVYLDGRAVAVPGATSFKLKAATKVASIGVALQGVMVNNDDGVQSDVLGRGGDSAYEADLILSKKLGDVNLKAIAMHRNTDNLDSANHVRVVASVNF